MDTAESIVVAWSLLFQIAWVIHFALRKWAFSSYTMRCGWIVYALAVPAVAVASALEGGEFSPKERGMVAPLAEQLGVGPKEMHDLEREARTTQRGLAA